MAACCLAALAAVLPLAGPWAGAASAQPTGKPAPAGPTPGSMAELRQQAARLAAEVQAQGIVMAKLDERADVATITAAQARARLHRAEATETTLRRQLRAVRAIVVSQAVAAYTNGGVPAFGPEGQASARAAIEVGYAEVVVHDEESVLAHFDVLLAHDRAVLHKLEAQRARAVRSRRQLFADRKAAAAEQARLQGLLSGVKGRLATAVQVAERRQQKAEEAKERALWRSRSIDASGPDGAATGPAPTSTSGFALPSAKLPGAPAGADLAAGDAPVTLSTTTPLTPVAVPSTTAAPTTTVPITTTTVPTTTSTEPITTTVPATTTTVPITATTVPATTVPATTVPATTTTLVTTTLVTTTTTVPTTTMTTPSTTTGPAATSATTTDEPTGPAPTVPATTVPVAPVPVAPVPTTTTLPTALIGSTPVPTTTTTAPGISGGTGVANTPAPGYETAIAFAQSQIGKPYQWGGAGPASYDCSGLVMVAWSKAEVMLPHSAQYQYNLTTRVAIADLQPGDLVFYGTPKAVYHVGLYIGDGQMIDAPETGEDVQVQTVYGPNLLGGGRVK